MRSILLAALVVISSLRAAGAQPQQQALQDQQIAFLSKALATLQTQRNAAMDDIVNIQARLAMANEQLAAATAERDAARKELEDLKAQTAAKREKAQ